MSAARRSRHAVLSTFLAARGDAELVSLVDRGRGDSVGVGGGSTVIDVNGERVFAKRIPLTERERAHPLDTANVFDLPVYCQYGIGSPGFTAWRELAANMIVTDGVLAGETESFPLLYHWRVLPGRPPVAEEYLDIDAAVARLGGGPNIRARLDALAAADRSLVLFCEYIPYPMEDWLREDPVSKAESVERQLARIVAFLRDRELLHMDGHFGNMRTDRELIYLTDFGLATSPRFDLSAAEREFVRRHVGHDAGYAAMRLVNWLVTSVCGDAGGDLAARNEYVRRCAGGYVPGGLPPDVAAILARHVGTAAVMNDFYGDLFGGDVRAVYSGL